MASHLLGIRPWEWELLSVQAADVVLDWLEEYHRKEQEAADRLNSN
jgi:hypothetical protein